MSLSYQKELIVAYSIAASARLLYTIGIEEARKEKNRLDLRE